MMQKKILSVLLALVFVLSLLPGTMLTASAATTHESHPVCGAEHISIGDHDATCEDLEWQVWDGTDMDPNTGGIQLTEGNWYLEEDVSFSDKIYIVGTVRFCFNGYYLKSTGAEGFWVDKENVLYLCDCSDVQRKFTVKDNGVWELDDENGTKTLTGGGITGVNTTGGIALKPDSGGTCYMYGGNIVGNTGTSTYSYAVIDIYNSNFYMYGGNICGNKAHIIVYPYNISRGNAYIYGGNIFENISAYGALGARNYSATINLGADIKISNNKDNDGKGADLGSGKFILLDGFSSRNTLYLAASTSSFSASFPDYRDMAPYFNLFSADSLKNSFLRMTRDNESITTAYYSYNELPSTDNNYTLTLNNETNATYKWYGGKATVVTPEMVVVSEYVSCNDATGVWSYISSGRNYKIPVLSELFLDKGDVVKVIFEDDYDGYILLGQNSEEGSDTLGYGSSFEESVSSKGIYNLKFQHSDYTYPDFKIYVIKNATELSGQTSKTLNTNGLANGFYKPEVIWTHGTPNDTSDDYSLTHLPYVMYTSNEIDGELTISGKAVVGKTLKAKYIGIETVTYQWYRDGAPISGATTKNYTLTEDDIGAIIKVVATGSGSFSGSVSAETTEILDEDPNPDAPEYEDEPIKPKEYVVNSSNVNELAVLFGDKAQVTSDEEGTITIKLLKDILGNINFEDAQNVNFILNLNGKTIDPETYMKYALTAPYSTNATVTVTITGTGTIKRGSYNATEGKFYYGLEDGKDYYMVTPAPGSSFNGRLTTTKSYSGDIYNTTTITQYNYTDFMVKYDRNGGDSYYTMADQYIVAGTPTALTKNNFRWNGKVFKGWATSADGDVVYTDEQVVTDLAGLGETITLYAVWEDEPLTRIRVSTSYLDVEWDANEEEIFDAFKEKITVTGSGSYITKTLTEDEYTLSYEAQTNRVVVTLKANPNVSAYVHVQFASAPYVSISLNKNTFEFEWNANITENFLKNKIGSVKLNRADGSTTTNYSFTVSNVDLDAKTAVVSSNGFSTTISWTIKPVPATNIQVSADLTFSWDAAITEESMKEKIGTITVVYADNSTVETDDYTVSDIDTSRNKVTLAYDSYSKAFTYTVEEVPYVSMEIETEYEFEWDAVVTQRFLNQQIGDSILLNLADGSQSYSGTYSITDIDLENNTAVVSCKGLSVTISWAFKAVPVTDIEFAQDALDFGWDVEITEEFLKAAIGTITIVYADDSTIETDDYTISDIDLIENTAVITFVDYTETFGFIVAEVPMTGIELEETAFDFAWNAVITEDFLKATIGNITLVYADDSTEETSDYTVSDIDLEEKNAVVSYGDFSETISWTIGEEPTVEAVMVSISANKETIDVAWNATQDDILNIANDGLIVTAAYNDESTEVLATDAYSVSYNADTKQVVITLTENAEFTATIAVNFASVLQTGIKANVETIEIPYGTKVATIADYIKTNISVNAVYEDESTTAVANFTVLVDGRADVATISAGDYTTTVAVTYVTKEAKLVVPAKITVPYKYQDDDESIADYIKDEFEGEVTYVDIYGEEFEANDTFTVVYSDKEATVSFEGVEATTTVKLESETSITDSAVVVITNNKKPATDKKEEDKKPAEDKKEEEQKPEEVKPEDTDKTEEDKKEDKTDVAPATKTFSDVHAKGHWAAADIDYVVSKGLMTGMSEDEFYPDAKVTRAMLVTVLYRNEGEPATNRSIPFADVDMGAYYANAVSWAKQVGIVSGITETEFAPNADITREQFATIMFRYAVMKGMDAITMEENLHFDDAASISEHAISAMNWAVGSGLINGRTETTVNPLDNATRAEMATILHRFLEK